MAYDEGLAQIFRDDLIERGTDIAEVKMFGGLLFKHRGHMLCGVHKIKATGDDGAMFRVGPENYEAALAIDGIEKLTFTKTPMKGLVESDAEIFDDDEKRRAVLDMALEFTSSLKPK
ncbi:MAG: hypothetical protein ABJN69_17955 [Hellea sp.]